MNESVKKSLEKSKNVLEEKRKMVKQKICLKKPHVYNNCYELRSRAINKFRLSVIKKPAVITQIVKQKYNKQKYKHEQYTKFSNIIKSTFKDHEKTALQSTNLYEYFCIFIVKERQ